VFISIHYVWLLQMPNRLVEVVGDYSRGLSLSSLFRLYRHRNLDLLGAAQWNRLTFYYKPGYYLRKKQKTFNVLLFCQDYQL
jgi:hypothetical protein